MRKRKKEIESDKIRERERERKKRREIEREANPVFHLWISGIKGEIREKSTGTGVFCLPDYLALPVLL